MATSYTSYSDNFWAPARRLLDFARVEAIRLDAEFLGTEHLLLGMLSDRESGAFQILQAIGARERDLFEAVHSLLDPIRSKGPFTGNLTFRAGLVVDLALEEALRLDSPVESELFLIGILRDGGGIATEALVRHGVSLARVRVELDLLGILQGLPWEALPGQVAA